jgi:hypothetical protein
MAYTAFNAAQPAGSQTGSAAIDSMRANHLALRDAILMGAMDGFVFSVSGGTASQPATMYWKNGTTWLRASITWGAGTGTDGNPTSIAWDLSINSGSDYTTAPGGAIDTQTFTWDSSGNLTATTGAGSWMSWLSGLLGKVKTLTNTYYLHSIATGTSAHGLGTISTQSAAAVAVTGGAIDGTTIGATTKALGTFVQAREVHAAVAFSAGGTLNCAAAASFDMTASGTGAATLAISNAPPSGSATTIMLWLTNGGLRTWTWPSGSKFAGGTAPTLTSSGTDLLTASTRDGGATWHWTMASKDTR